MAKSKETYLKVAETRKKIADRAWARAKNNPDEGYQYQIARYGYQMAENARKAAKKAK